MIKKMNRNDLGFKSLTAYTVLYNIHTYKSREHFIYEIKNGIAITELWLQKCRFANGYNAKLLVIAFS